MAVGRGLLGTRRRALRGFRVCNEARPLRRPLLLRGLRVRASSLAFARFEDLVVTVLDNSRTLHICPRLCEDLHYLDAPHPNSLCGVRRFFS